jgi:hypothetical protein
MRKYGGHMGKYGQNIMTSDIWENASDIWENDEI